MHDIKSLGSPVSGSRNTRVLQYEQCSSFHPHFEGRVNEININTKQLNKIALINALKVIVSYYLKHPETLPVFDTDKLVT